MQAVILAAGSSSRFYPFNVVHKSMVYLLGKPILAHTIEALKKIGIKELIIVENQTNQIQNHFGNGKKFGVSIMYVVQEKPEGAGNALLLAAKYVEGDFLLLNASHVDMDAFAKNFVQAKRKKNQAFILVTEKDNPWDYGVVKFAGDRVEGILEKPKKGSEPSKLCVVGIYLLPSLFLKTLSGTSHEHYQLESAISRFAKEGSVGVVETKKEVVTLKYSWDLLSIKNYLLGKMKKFVGKNVLIAKSAEIIGEVFIGNNVRIMEGARIKGPCYIGENVTIGNNALLRGGVDVEENATVGSYMEAKNSLIMKGSTTHGGFIGDSLIGKNVKIGTQFSTANVRIDRDTIKVEVKGERVDSGLKFLGTMMGDGVKVGIKASTMPGVIIGENSVIGPSTTVIRNIAPNSNYYTKFQEIIEEKNEKR